MSDLTRLLDRLSQNDLPAAAERLPLVQTVRRQWAVSKVLLFQEVRELRGRQVG